MTGSIVARRYAKALFALVAGPTGSKRAKKTQTALESVAKDLAFFVSCLKDSPQLESLFRNPVFSPAEKRAVLAVLVEKGGVGNTVRDFVYLLADKERLAYLRNIDAEFRSMLDEEKGILRGEFVSAIPLDAKKREELLATLEKKAGKPLALEFSVDPAILGGMLLRIGDTVRDASLKTQLSLLTDTIKRGE